MSNLCECPHTFDNTPMFICPVCGKIDVFGSTTTPEPMHWHDGIYYQKIPNEAAKAALQSIDAWHAERAASRKRAEEQLKDWPP